MIPTDVADWWSAVEHQEGPPGQGGEQQVAERTRGRGEAPPAIVADGTLIQVDRAAGQADPPNQEEHDGQGDAEHRMRVLQRVQREVTGCCNRPITTEIGNERVAELVNAE